MKIAIVIPTRNRAELAQRAIRSVISQPDCEIVVLVSDNSTVSSEREKLARYCSNLNDSRVIYVQPHRSLPMPEHWQWALTQVLQVSDVNHFLYLTDRMVFRRKYLGSLLRVGTRYEDKVIAYAHDRLIDNTSPVQLELYSWSGSIFELNSAELLGSMGTLNWIPGMCLPRMLNCLVPRKVLEEVAQRYGDAFASTAPDFCFAFRALAILDSILYFDKPLLVHYALSRSNGASQERGVISSDHSDFLQNLKVTQLNYAAPIPEFLTVMNSVIHEYCLVAKESRSPKFVPINLRNYLDYIAYEINRMEKGEIRTQLEVLLKKHASGIDQNLGQLKHVKAGPEEIYKEFKTADEAILYAETHHRSRSWLRGNEELNMHMRLVLWQDDPIAYLRFPVAYLLEKLRVLIRQTRYQLDRHLLWRLYSYRKVPS